MLLQMRSPAHHKVMTASMEMEAKEAPGSLGADCYVVDAAEPVVISFENYLHFNLSLNSVLPVKLGRKLDPPDPAGAASSVNAN